MKKSEVNFVINVLMFLCMSAVAGIGFLIKYTLISGQERWVVYNDNVQLYFWGLDRHEWGTIHLIVGYVLLGLLLLHIVLHWNMVVGVYHKMFGQKPLVKFISVLIVSICALFMIVPFFIHPTISKEEQGKRRHVTNHDLEVFNETSIAREKKDDNTIKHIKECKHSNVGIEVRGYMTLNEISKKYKVPIEFIKTRLNLPKSVSGEQKMGWLRKRYSIEMHDAEVVIVEYREVND